MQTVTRQDPEADDEVGHTLSQTTKAQDAGASCVGKALAALPSQASAMHKTWDRISSSSDCFPLNPKGAVEP
jgi:hypothetical protein